MQDNLIWFVLVNPNAGSGKGRTDWERISRELILAGFKFKTAFTSKPGEAINIVSEAIVKEGYKKFISVGGDGTLNEVVNGIYLQNTIDIKEIVLGVITVGTGNDWARTFGIPVNYKAAVKLLKKNHVFCQDVGRITFTDSAKTRIRYFINIAGFGFDAKVAYKTNKLKTIGKKGVILYLYSLIAELIKYKSRRISFTIDSEVYSEKIFSVSIGIGRYNGGGMQQAPKAVPNDGLFDLTLIKNMSKLRVVRSMHRLYNGSILSHSLVESFTGRSISVDSGSEVLLEADGESLGHAPFHFEILPRSLNVIVNQEKVKDWFCK